MTVLGTRGGVMGRPVIDITGQRFGRLLVIERLPVVHKSGQIMWRCACDCGTLIERPGYLLRDGRVHSCGCLRVETRGLRFRTHGKSKTPEYRMFYDAQKRALKLGIPFEIEPGDVLIPPVCPVLGLVLSRTDSKDTSPSLDRIIPERGYVKGNVRVISFRANRIKSDASASELECILAYIRTQEASNRAQDRATR